MKRQFIFSMVTLIAVITMVSCKKYTAQTAVLNDKNDSINYALGYANGDGIKNYYMSSVEDEDAAIKAFIEALDKAFNSNAEPDEMYELGMNIGTYLKQQQKDGLMGEPDLKFDYKLVKQGLENGLTGTTEGWSASDAQNYIQMAMMQMQAEKMGVLQNGMDEFDYDFDDDLFIEEEVIEIEE